MNHNTVPVPREMFSTAWVRVAAVMSAMAALCGLASVALLLSPEMLDTLVRDLVLGGITDRSAVITWKVIHVGVTVIGCVWACFMTVQLCTVAAGKAGQGLLRLSTAAEWTVHGQHVSGIAVLILFAYKLIRYVIVCLGINEGAYLLYSMLVSEALMAAQAGFLFVLIKRFLNSLSDTAAGMARAVTSGNMGKGDISYFAVTGFILLAVVELVIAGDRLFTVTIVDAFPRDYYAFLVTDSPLLLASGGMFALCALTNVLLSMVLYRFRRLGERLHFEANRMKQ